MSRATHFAFAIAAALVACASPPHPAVDPRGWHEVRLPGFVVVGDVEPEVLHQLASELALFRSLVKKVTNAPIERESVPVRLYVFRNSDEAKPFTFIDWAAGVMIPDLSGYFAVLGDIGGYSLTRWILLHEYTHYVIRSGRRHAYPPWYDEGLSEFLSATRFRDDCVIVGATLSGRLRDLELLGSMPLDELFDPVVNSVRDVYRFYATAWALVHYLNSSPEDRASLGNYVRRLARGEDWRSAYQASFDRSLESLEAALAEHIAKLQQGARLDYHLRLGSLAVPKDLVEVEVPPAEIAYQLGGVARLGVTRGRDWKNLVTARLLFEQAIESDPTHDRARAALAWALAMEEKWEKSRAQLAQVEQAAATDPVVALEVGRVAVLRAQLPGAGSAERDTARAALEAAVRLGPEQPAAHAALGRFYASTGGEPRLAIAAFERARELGAWSPPVDVELARQYLAVGERDRAEALLHPVAADPDGGETAEEARELLRETGDSAARQ